MRQQGADMAGRTFQMTTHRVVDESLIGRALAPPTRRFMAFGVDVGLLAVPTILAAFFCAALALRVSDRPAYDAIRALVAGEVRTEAAAVDVMTALLPQLVEVGADGLPLEAITAVKAGRSRDWRAIRQGRRHRALVDVQRRPAPGQARRDPDQHREVRAQHRTRCGAVRRRRALLHAPGPHCLGQRGQAPARDRGAPARRPVARL